MIPLRQVNLAGVYPVPTGAFGIPWGRETEEERRRTYVGQRAWAPPAYRPAPGRRVLGQEEEIEVSYPLDPSYGSNALLLISSGTAIGYTVLASLIYGKYKVLDHILLGVGAAFYGLAAVSSFTVPATYRRAVLYSNKLRSRWDPVLGMVFGTVNSLATLGAIGAAINPKLIARKGTIRGAIAEALPG